MDMPRMPLSTASAVTFLYALGYPASEPLRRPR